MKYVIKDIYKTKEQKEREQKIIFIITELLKKMHEKSK